MIDLLKELFDHYNISYTEDMLNSLKKYYKLVIEKNEVMNLTNLTDERDFAIKNILDSVLPVNAIPPNAKVVDIGAGAGFPSIPLKILRPDLNMVMVDSLNKRVTFLKEVIDKLKLTNIVAVHSRAEDFANNNREYFDVAVARAVAKLNTLSEYCLPLVRVGGKLIAYKSLKADEEIKESKNALNILGGKISHLQNILVKEIDSIRINVIIKKFKQTPKEYPRSKNLPKTKPIE
ncbi:MAG: 16S rRNA (guanine(527)-N(7))-methyltransferase RsmG [Clostridia bacterium]|nr:16S rRNA (guanine(527)-N(7))-methyltransferase RsmG [Clostridia bacterium]